MRKVITLQVPYHGKSDLSGVRYMESDLFPCTILWKVVMVKWKVGYGKREVTAKHSKKIGENVAVLSLYYYPSPNKTIYVQDG